MKKIVAFCFLLGQFITNAQETNNQTYSCGSDKIQQQLIKDNPELAVKMANYEMAVKQNSQTAKGTLATTYKIPVVVHVMHIGEAIGTGTNISDDIIKAKIRAINEDYRKIPGSRGDGAGVDMGIEFVLAVIDPNGNQTSGIVHYDMSSNTSYKNYGINHYTSNGISEASLKALSLWDSTKYYNIWVVSKIDNNNSISGVQAWATFASSHGTATDGAVVLSSHFKDLKSNVETHELGHSLNLYHTFEGDGNGSTCPSSDPTLGDFCADTPPHKRNTADCTVPSNSCYPNNTDLSYLNNYMNYSSDGCRNMFTQNQKDRAISAIKDLRKSFLDTSSTNNLIANAAPTADFFPSKPVVITVGASLQLSDASIGVPNNYLNYNSVPGMTFNWTVTDGNTTFTSTEQNPVFTFNSTGKYSISHDVNNGLGSDSKTVNQVIYVIDASPELPSTTLKSTSSGYDVIDYVKFNEIQKNTYSATNIPYVDYINTDKTTVVAGNTYQLILNVTSGTTYSEYFGAYIDYNGDGVFSDNETLGMTSIPAKSARVFGVDVTIDKNSVKNKLLRMRIAGNANGAITNSMLNGKDPFFIGDTKDFGLYIIDQADFLKVDDFNITNLNYYPNPVNEFMNFSNSENIDKVEIHSITGQLLLSQKFEDTNIKIDLSNLKTGTYIATVYSNGKKSSVKVLKN